MNISRPGLAAAAIAMVLAACQPLPPVSGPVGEAFSFQQSLPFEGSPFDLFVDDIDGDGRPDIALVSHGGNYAQVFFQKTPRNFSPGPRIPEVGFHPGELLRWPSGRRLYLAAGEGVNQLLALEPRPDGGFSLVSHLSEEAPRHAALFRWPGWGASLVVSPFEKDFLVLLRDFDPLRGLPAARLVVPLGDRGGLIGSVRRAGRVVPADLDGDGVDELVFTIPLNNSLWMIRHPDRTEDAIAPIRIRDFKRGLPHQVAATDLNDDGATDLLVANQIQPFQVHVLLNDGHGGVGDATPLPFPTEMGLRQVAAGRDKDGANYLLAVGYGAVAIYRFPPGWDGRTAVPMQSVPMARKEASQDLVLHDLDGDGWLDGIVGRSHQDSDKGAWIIYGPLWEHFETLAAQQFVLN